MKTIPLSATKRCKRSGLYVAIVDDSDYEALSVFTWRALVQGRTPNLRVYAIRNSDGARMHRLVWVMRNGELPSDVEVDHIEPGLFCGLDNRRLNLRLTTKSLNQANSRIGRNNSSGFKGVWWQKQARLWRADIWVNRKKLHIGYFIDKEEAAHAYDRAAIAAFGLHARLNFPSWKAA